MSLISKKKIIPTSYLLLLLIAAVKIGSNHFDSGYSALISYSFFVILISLFLLFFGKARLAVASASYLIIAIQLINQLKIHFYKEGLLFTDIHVAFDPNNLETLLHYPSVLAALIGLVSLFIFNIWLFFNTAKISNIYRYSTLILIFFLSVVILNVSQSKNNIDTWQKTLPKGATVVTNLFMSAQKMIYSAPEFTGDANYFLEQKFDYTANQSKQDKPDIIAFLQESTVNPAIYTLPANSIPTFKMFKLAASTKASSLMRVQTYGGATWLSEFAFLTGLNSDDFGANKNSVFYTVAPNIKTSIFQELKNNGYFTVVLTPMSQRNYNAGPTYQHLGVDLILQPQQLGYPGNLSENLWRIPSQAMLDSVKKILAKYTDQPIFVYVISMNEHSPYHTDHSDDYQLKDKIDNPDTVGQFNHYLSKIKLLDDATEDFNHFVIARSRPTMFIYFGDHQAMIGWDGGYNTTIGNPQYLTQFVLRDNISGNNLQNLGGLTDITFLSGLLLERAGLAVSPFFNANIRMRNLCKGELNDCADKQLVNSYKHYIYQDLKNAG